MTFKATAVFLATMFASPLGMTMVSVAHGKNSGGSSTVISFKAKLAPPGPVPVSADLSGEIEGEAKYTKKTSSKGTEEKFKGEVEFPMDLADLTGAVAAVYDMHLARGGTDYAVCSLVIKEIEFDYQSGTPPVLVGTEAEYVVDVSQKTPLAGPPTLKQKVGGCTATDLVTPVFPVVLEGDTATVFLHPDTLTPLLTGTFVPSSGD